MLPRLEFWFLRRDVPWLALPRSFRDDPSSGVCSLLILSWFSICTRVSAELQQRNWVDIKYLLPQDLPRLQVQLPTYYCGRQLWLFLANLVVESFDRCSIGRMWESHGAKKLVTLVGLCESAWLVGHAASVQKYKNISTEAIRYYRWLKARWPYMGYHGLSLELGGDWNSTSATRSVCEEPFRNGSNVSLWSALEPPNPPSRSICQDTASRLFFFI